MEIKLIVIRTGDAERLSGLYSFLGLSFEHHQHGKSPFHYSATLGNTVFEIYPLTKNQTEADASLRLGFALDNFDSTIELMKANETVFVAEPIDTEFGYMATVEDTDGRKIELYRK